MSGYLYILGQFWCQRCWEPFGVWRSWYFLFYVEYRIMDQILGLFEMQFLHSSPWITSRRVFIVEPPRKTCLIQDLHSLGFARCNINNNHKIKVCRIMRRGPKWPGCVKLRINDNKYKKKNTQGNESIVSKMLFDMRLRFHLFKFTKVS